MKNTLLKTAWFIALPTVLAFASSPLFAQRTPRSGSLIPRNVFFRSPQKTSVQVSPDGKQIAYLAPLAAVMNLWVQPVDGSSDSARPITASALQPVRNFFWAMNSRQLVYEQYRTSQGNVRMYAVSIEDGNEIELTPFENARATFIATSNAHPDEFLITLNQRDPSQHDVCRLNTLTGQITMVLENESGFTSFMADLDMNPRLAMRMSSNGVLKAFTRSTLEDPWDQLIAWGPQDQQTSGPVGFSADGQSLFLLDSRESNTGGLFVYTSTEDGEGTYDFVASDTKSDVRKVIMDPIKGLPQAIGFEYAKREWRILDESIRSDWDYLTSFDEGTMELVSRSADDRKWIVTYEHDNSPKAYYMYDRDVVLCRFLFTDRPELESLPLASMKSVNIQARDGLELVGYLTRPIDAQNRPTPMVLLVHGGPWSRDSWGYNPIHQWLANRGYSVLSVNYRGSVGFGKPFIDAGDRQWASKMHEDLVDAVQWAINERVASPGKVAIMGSSYGGYASLVGLSFTPDVFAAGVDIAGPVHVKTLLESLPAHLASIFKQRVGFLSETDFLNSISPLSKADAIVRPLLIGHGQHDPRVKSEEIRHLINSMQARNIPVTYITFPDEGHGFARPENNLAFLAITEAFLSQHLGGYRQPIIDELRDSSAKIPAGAGQVPGLSEAMR